ncbi:MAG: endolytic transglycosylase MltG [Halothiobacillus sp.]
MKRAFGLLIVWGLTLGLLASLVLGVGFIGSRLMRPLLSPNAPAITIEIPSGTDAQRIARIADAAGAQLDPMLFAWIARLRGQARDIKAGEYQITAQDRLLTFLDRLVAGDVVRYRLTITEGSTAQDFLNALAAEPALTHTLQGLNSAQMIKALNLPIMNLEGWLFPDTYIFTRGTTDRKILQEAYRSMKTHLDAAWATRAPNLPLKTPYDALILASIVEKETGLPAERAEVAGVFVNRLNLGMRLQTDPAVIYGVALASLGQVDEQTAPRSLTATQLRSDTPYNTYLHTGLPPTPIALPSEAALQAVTQPAATDALYFVANGTGGHTFSRTLQGHNQAVQTWRRVENQRNTPAQNPAKDPVISPKTHEQPVKTP